MPDPIPAAADGAGVVLTEFAAAADGAESAAIVLRNAVGAGDLGEPRALRMVTGALAVAVANFPALFRALSGRAGPAEASFWFQMEASAAAADRLLLALDTGGAALPADGAGR